MNRLLLSSLLTLCLFTFGNTASAAAIAAAAGGILGGVGSLASAFSGVKCGDKTGVQMIDGLIRGELGKRLKKSGKLNTQLETCVQFNEDMSQKDFGINLSDYRYKVRGDYDYLTPEQKKHVDEKAMNQFRSALRNFGERIPKMRKACDKTDAQLAGLAAREKIELPQAMQDTVQQFCR